MRHCCVGVNMFLLINAQRQSIIAECLDQITQNFSRLRSMRRTCRPKFSTSAAA
jgi:hypothetical protein